MERDFYFLASFLSSCLSCFVTESGERKFPLALIEFSVSSLVFTHYYRVLLSGAHVFMISFHSHGINPLIITHFPSLSIVITFLLKSVLTKCYHTISLLDDVGTNCLFVNLYLFILLCMYDA